MKTVVPNSLHDAKSSMDSWKNAFANTFKQLVEKGKELQQVTEQLFVPQLSKDFPRIDIVEGKDEMFVVIELPGMEKDDFQLEVGGGSLFIRGEKKNPLQNRAVGVHLSECPYGKFERTILLPYRIQDDKVEAEFHAGVLTIMTPKLEGQPHPRVSVKIR